MRMLAVGWDILIDDRAKLLQALEALMSHWGPYNPGHSDLDDEQPESIPTTLGELRKINMLLQRIKHHEKEQLSGETKA